LARQDSFFEDVLAALDPDVPVIDPTNSAMYLEAIGREASSI